jgi:hypothetical protein
MRPLQKMSNPIPSIPVSLNSDGATLPVLTDRAKGFITARLERGESPARIAAGLRAYFEIEIDPAQVIPFWKGEILFPTQTGYRQDDKESVQFPADAQKEPLFTVMTPDETPDTTSEAAHALFTIAPGPDPVRDGADGENGEDAPTTQTGHRQNEEESLQVPLDTVDAGEGARARRDGFEALGALVRAKLGIAPDPAPDPAAATQTGRRQDQKTTVLTDEMKTFIVKGLARYETPTRVAASVQAAFGIAIDRRQVFAYDPAGSRPPAQRWIKLHAATRARFLRAASEIGVAQQVVRLRMLDRYANRADENNQMERAAAFLAQAAKECGGFYARYQRPKAAALR